tara:strand:+ start:27965 stop:28597 length:633 start_codon:yes stop_codon:yes gene_type:complete
MNNSDIFKKGFLIKIIEKALSLWIRSKCNKVNSLKVEIETSTSFILNGYVNSSYIIGKQINFQDILIDYVELRSGSLSFNINLFSKELTFNKDFNINGKINLISKELKYILLSSKWEWLGSFLSKELLGAEKLNDLNIKGNLLSLSGIDTKGKLLKQDDFYLISKYGKLFLTNNDSSKSVFIPMDKSITFEKAVLESNKMILYGSSQITV